MCIVIHRIVLLRFPQVQIEQVKITKLHYFRDLHVLYQPPPKISHHEMEKS